MTSHDLTAWLTEKTATLLQIPSHYIDPTQPFASLGMDSMGMLELTGDLASHLGRELPPSLVWEHPTINALAAHLSLASAELDEPPIVPVPRDARIPQTYAQERMWREFQLNGHDPRQIVWRRLRFQGVELNLAVLKDCVARLMMRHEPLRTTFAEMEGVPVQQIHPAPLGGLGIIDLTGQEDAEQRARDILGQVVRSPFDLTTGPLVHFHLVILDKGNYLFSLIVHHILCDGESNRILVEDLGQLYQAAVDGGSADVSGPAPLTVQTADFASWQRHWLKEDGPAYAKHAAWWNDLLGDRPPGLACAGLRWDQPPDTPDLERCRVRRRIPGEVNARLAALSVQEGTSLATVFYAAMVLALSQHGTEPRALVGSYVTDRRRPALRRLTGLYVNLVVQPLPEVPPGGFLQTLRMVTQTMHQMALHQDLPFEELVKAREQAKLYAPHPLMIFNYRRRAEMPDFFVPGSALSAWKSTRQRTVVPWGMSIVGLEDDTHVELNANFDIGLYDPDKVERMMQTLVTTLEEAAAPVTTAHTGPASFAAVL